MFTGIIRLVGVVERTRPVTAGTRLAIRYPVSVDTWAKSPGIGDSIAVDGCCLTVAAPPTGSPETGGAVEFDAIPETLAKTTLGALAEGSRVHLEQAATMGTLLDGHVVQGHVDGVAEVASVVSSGEWRIRLVPPGPLMQFIVPKGSVTLSGVSLTVAEVDPAGGWFEVALIPTTLAKTNLGELRAHSRVNLECDAMAKTVVHWLRHYSGAPSTGPALSGPTPASR